MKGRGGGADIGVQKKRKNEVEEEKKKTCRTRKKCRISKVTTTSGTVFFHEARELYGDREKRGEGGEEKVKKKSMRNKPLR